MKLFQFSSWKDALIHLGILLGAFLIILLVFFYIYLPSNTNHGETLTVPDLVGIESESLDDFLLSRNLRYEITADSSYSAEYPAFTVLKQYPKAGAKVKENRKIYVSLNAKNPPKVKMPRLVDGSLKNAQMVLQSYGLLMGDIRYVPHQFQNAVLEQKLGDVTIEEGMYLPKGSKINLVVGDGLGRSFAIPNVMGQELEDGKFILVGSGLKISKVTSERNPVFIKGHIIRQFPPAGQSVKIGDFVELVVAEADDTDAIITPALKNEDDND